MRAIPSYRARESVARPFAMKTPNEFWLSLHELANAYAAEGDNFLERDEHVLAHGELLVGVLDGEPLGPVHRLNLDQRDFDPLGRYVVGVGQTLGRQQGRILAYGYEWRDSFIGGEWFATDYLIKGEGNLPFAAPGDSGKLVVTDDENRQPIALLWGGEQRFDSSIPAQQALAYSLAFLSNSEQDRDAKHKMLDGAEDLASRCATSHPKFPMGRYTLGSVHAILPYFASSTPEPGMRSRCQRYACSGDPRRARCASTIRASRASTRGSRGKATTGRCETSAAETAPS